jgi:hypothetical protein
MKMMSVDPELRPFSHYGTGAAEVSGVSDDDTLGAGPIVGALMMTCVLASQKPATSAIMIMDHERITT